jgi:hypothetical protein
LAEFVTDSGRQTLSGITEFSQRIETDGTMSPLVRLSKKNQGRYSHCVVKQDDGYVEIDSTRDIDQYLHLEVPRVTRIGANGTPVWETPIGFDHGRRILRDSSTHSNSDDQIFGCAGLAIDKSGRIVAAARVFVFPDLKTDDEVFQEMTRKQGRDLRSATLLLTMDPDGKEVTSVRLDDTTAGLLVDSPLGALLFETSEKRSGASNSVDIVGQRLSLHIFSSELKELKELKPPIVFQDTNFDKVNSAYTTPEGGILLKGCPDDEKDRNEYLRYVAPSGAISPKRHVADLGGFCGGLFSFSPGAAPGEVLMLAQTPQQGNLVLVLKYSN